MKPGFLLTALFTARAVCSALAGSDDSLWHQSREVKDKAAAAKRRFASQDGTRAVLPM